MYGRERDQAHGGRVHNGRGTPRHGLHTLPLRQRPRRLPEADEHSPLAKGELGEHPTRCGRRRVAPMGGWQVVAVAEVEGAFA